MTALTLVSHGLCPYVQRAAIALLEKGIAFERITIDLDDKPDWFKALSPLGKVPLLQVRRPGAPDAVLFESSVICEYIEETQPEPALHPADPLHKARHRGWMEFGSTILADLWGYETAKDRDVLEAKRAALAAKFARVEAELGAGPFFAGETFSLVDAVYAPIFRYFDVFDRIAETHVFDGLERVTAWRQALATRPSVLAAAPCDYADRLMAFLERHDAALLRLPNAGGRGA
ncbi:glutathione S-transferase family protein [Alsobacter sp. KACC 23698]|uniref:glutathione transferase n=1 Tax=Alsobacter sp. KACC 23698 TaxID=3149229 RepID=A0AAU7JDF8_9HYPH